MCICLQAPNHKKKSFVFFPSVDFVLVVILIKKKSFVPIVAIPSHPWSIQLWMRWTEEFLVSHVRQRIFAEYTFETAFGVWRLHEKLFITTYADPSKYEVRIDQPKKKTSKWWMEQRLKLLKELNTKKKKFTQRQSHTISLQWHTKIKKIITLNIRTRNNSSQLIERRCFDVPKAKKKNKSRIQTINVL